MHQVMCGLKRSGWVEHRCETKQHMLCMIVTVTACTECCAAAYLEGQSVASNTPFEFIGLAHQTHTQASTPTCVYVA